MIREQEQEYERLRIEHETRKEDCESKMETYADTSRMIRAVEAQHNHEFPQFYELEFVQGRVAELHERIRVKHNNPSLTREELDKVVPSIAKQRLEKMFQAQIQSLCSYTRLSPEIAELLISNPKEVQEQSLKVKKLFREGLLLAHPDKHTADLTEADQALLRACFEEIIEIRPNIHLTPFHYHHNENQIKKLEAIIARIKQIRTRARIDCDVDTSEASIEERIAFLKAKIAGYEAITEELTSKIFCLLNSERLNTLRAHLSLPDELKEELNEQIGNKVVVLKAKQDQLEAELEELFVSNPGTCDAISGSK